MDEGMLKLIRRFNLTDFNHLEIELTSGEDAPEEIDKKLWNMSIDTYKAYFFGKIIGATLSNKDTSNYYEAINKLNEMRK